MSEIDFEKRTVELLKAQFAALRDLAAARRADDAAAHANAGSRLVRLDSEIATLLKAESARLRALLKLPANADDEARVAQLLLAFRQGAKLKRVWIDLLGDSRAGSRVAKRAWRVIPLLDAIGDGRRTALACFLDDKDADVRATAAAALLKIMPERAVPILEEISHSGKWLSAGSTAMINLLMYRSGA